jgi:ABC-type uncharacterized transport system auxiliary subunit
MTALARMALASVLAGVIAGCVSSDERGFQRYHVLGDAGMPTIRAQSRRASTLLVTPTTASSFYETQEIVYSRAAGMRAYYQFHAWTERPSRTISELLMVHLEHSGSFTVITRAASGVQGSLILNSHLSEFYYDASTDPGTVRVVLTAALIDPARRVLVARRTFSRVAPAVSHDAPGAVRGFNMAVGEILDDITAWVDASAPR